MPFALPLNFNPSLQNSYTENNVIGMIFEIPLSQRTITVDINNPIGTTSESWVFYCGASQTTNLFGTLFLDYSDIYIDNPHPFSSFYTAGFNDNKIIFKYNNNPITSKQQLGIGDIINGWTITKVLNFYNNNYCYAELENGNLPFTYNINYVSNNNVSINVKSGKGIKYYSGLVGVFDTNNKDIFYYVNFYKKHNVTNNFDFKDDITQFNNINPSTNLTEYNIEPTLYKNYISDNTLSNINNNFNFLNDINVNLDNEQIILDGTDLIDTPIKIRSWWDIPYKNEDISFGIKNFRQKDNRTDLINVNYPINVKFNRFYKGVDISNGFIPTATKRLIDNWLIHEWALGASNHYYDPETNSCTTEPTNPPPYIIYNKDNDGNILQVSNVITETLEKIYQHLFVGNDIIYNTQDGIDYKGVQNEININCNYIFDPSPIGDVNSDFNNHININSFYTFLLEDVTNLDNILYVSDTSQFFNNGYLILYNYSKDPYTYYGYEILYYSDKTDNSFLNCQRGLYNTTPLNVKKSSYLNQYFIKKL